MTALVLAVGSPEADGAPHEGRHLKSIPQVPVTYGRCPETPGVRGCYSVAQRRIYVNAPRRSRSALAIREHERGHAFDWLLLSGEERLAIMQFMGWEHWRHAFMDAFAACRLTAREREESAMALGRVRPKLCQLIFAMRDPDPTALTVIYEQPARAAIVPRRD